MKNIILILVFLNTIIFGMKVNTDFFLQVIQKRFDNIQVKNQKINNTLNKYFNGKKYIIAKEFNLENRYKIYFAVLEYKLDLYYNSISNGVLITENAEVIVQFNKDKGVYVYEQLLFDFKKIGIKQNEIGAFVISIEKSFGTGTINLQLIDNEDNVFINPEIKKNQASFNFTWFNLSLDYHTKKFLFELGPTIMETETEIYDKLRKHVEAYRKAKAQGIVVKTAALKSQYEKYLKEGQVEMPKKKK